MRDGGIAAWMWMHALTQRVAQRLWFRQDGDCSEQKEDEWDGVPTYRPLELFGVDIALVYPFVITVIMLGIMLGVATGWIYSWGIWRWGIWDLVPWHWFGG